MTDEKLIALWNSRHSDRPTPVRKSSGDYRWDGVLVAVFDTPGGKLRAVVAHPVNTGYVLHIYSAAQIEVATEPAADINKGAVAMWGALLRADSAAEGAGFDADLIVALAARVAKAEADRDRLRAALEPFTKEKTDAPY